MQIFLWSNPCHKNTPPSPNKNLQIYPTERLTDADDGGGLMVKDPLAGRENELFTPISDVARTIGALTRARCMVQCALPITSRLAVRT